MLHIKLQQLVDIIEYNSKAAWGSSSAATIAPHSVVHKTVFRPNTAKTVGNVFG